MGFTRSIYGSALAVFAAVLAVCAVSASAAFAEETPEWQQGKAKLSEAVKTKSKGNIKFFDLTVPAEVECESSGEGTAGPGAADKTTSWTLSNCKPTPKALNKKGEEKPNACAKAEGAEILNLPWEGELTITSKSIFNRIFTALHPGFAVTCEVAGLKATDRCFAEGLTTLSGAISNVTGGVDEALVGQTFDCSIGGTTGGALETKQFIEATSGSALEANIV